MSKGLKTYFQELFLILASIIGMGFATGKEIQHFFCHNYAVAIIAVVIFLVCFVLFFSACTKFVKNKNVANYQSFNKELFGEYDQFINIGLIIIYCICCASMLAGIDTIARERFFINFPIFSISLSAITYFVLIGGKNRIENLFLKFVPILLLSIFINLFVNAFNFTDGFLNFSQVFSYDGSGGNVIFAFFLPLLFFGGNFVLAINSVITIKSNKNLIKWSSAILFAIFLFLAVVVIICYNNFETMPFLSVSKNLSKVFYCIYLLAIILALISTLIISSYNTTQLVKSRSKFSILILVIFNQILSFFGFNFIIKYLYTFSGLLGLIYCVIAYIKMIYLNKKTKLIDNKINKNK